MFKKVLVANRGEIAVRIIRTLREMGIASVAIHSEPDTTALHVRLADEVRCLGGFEPHDNYLNIEAIIAAAQDTGADAIHPGYGFLSENPAFPRALQEVGVTFIGPSAEAMERVGNKIEARRLMREAAIPVIPGLETYSDDPEVLALVAEEVGYPVLVKAAAGGGGKGMRVVSQPKMLTAAVREARSEAEAAFGDGTVYIERYLYQPRHVEFQILADNEGNCVHLYERECSIQRRHQKIIEECPSPAVNAALRERMGAAAITAAQISGYVNAGTVEFLLDGDGQFYFLEVNARLQVEHPVTEMVTGIDMVKKQLEIAAGGSLGLTQEQVHCRGHALECRIYAEDPVADFAPSPGRISILRSPSGPGVRFDEGVVSGSEVPKYYDPILAKLITCAEDRPATIARMVRALQSTVILGVQTSLEYMADLIRSQAFCAGQTHTALAESFRADWQQSEFIDDIAVVAAIARQLSQSAPGIQHQTLTGLSSSAPTPWQTLGLWDIVRQREAKKETGKGEGRGNGE